MVAPVTQFDEFTAHMAIKVIAFNKWWNANHLLTPSKFPLNGTPDEFFSKEFEKFNPREEVDTVMKEIFKK